MLDSVDRFTLTNNLAGDLPFQCSDFESHCLNSQHCSVIAITASAVDTTDIYAYIAYLISLINSVRQLANPIESVQYLNPFSKKDFLDEKMICVDVKATDTARGVSVVEMQIVVQESFAKRALYCACKSYTDQLKKGQGHSDLRATYSVCLLMRRLWDDDLLHYQFQLVERASVQVFGDSIEIHTVELSKYNGCVSRFQDASILEQWCYWIKNADQHTHEELRALLPGLEFLHATDELSDIQQTTEEKEMYDSREKAILDYESDFIDARREGRQEGLQAGLQKGEMIGRILLLQKLLVTRLSKREELDLCSI